MKRLSLFLSLALSSGALLQPLCAPALAAPGGKLGTLQRGTYVCELPGDAATRRGVPLPDDGFEITNSSTYAAKGGSGTYLRTGDLVQVTSGPMKGDRYTVQSEGFLRKQTEKGAEGTIRCVRLGATPN